MSISNIRQLDSFTLCPKDMTHADIPHLHELSVAVGWMHRAQDWATVLELGEGIFLSDEIGRPCGSAMWFPMSDDLAMLGMVITTPRLQERGAGRWMMEQILARTGGRDLALNATRAAFRLYLALDFQPGPKVWQRMGLVSAIPEQSPRTRPMCNTDHAAIHDLDSRAYGTNRHTAIELFLRQSTGTVIEDAGRITGYSLCRRFGRGHVVGPIVAATAQDAAALAAPHIAHHHGSFLRIDTQETEGPFIQMLTDCGLAARDTVTFMSRGRKRICDPSAHVFALANQAVG
ncbi:N-acetyltransferase [Paracoccus sp. Z330]|uniref:N-acetyltransferase n=1 Tax=Paracoccus onchidii TaxID=3017813 RepID=A0ABT4ZE98_9RHOB|nr:N-acetyltransferase [Paracoccus onchidii]MDB6177667.1 N-acetyltransferase [Paracoccus onchidii]